MSIFGPAEPPEWMRGLGAENRKVAGELGATLGTSLAAGLMVASGAKGDPDPMTGEQNPLSFSAAYQRARLNQVDPLWGLKAQQMKINAQDATFQMQAASLALKDASEERQARLKDLPTVREWMKQPDTEAKWNNLPDVGSQWARGAVDAQVRQHDAKELKEQQLETQRQAVQNKMDIAAMQQKGIARRVKAETDSPQHVAETQVRVKAHADLVRRNSAHAARLAAEDHAAFLKDLEAVRDPALRAEIRALPAHPDGSPSAGQWRALRDALRAANPASAP